MKTSANSISVPLSCDRESKKGCAQGLHIGRINHSKKDIASDGRGTLSVVWPFILLRR